MNNKSSENIVYFPNIETADISEKGTKLPFICTVQHKSWNLIKEQLEKTFIDIGKCKPESIFVFGFLRNGKISPDDEFCIYTDSDCLISDEVLKKDDEICSEEYCAEILMPFFSKYYPGAKVNQFLTPEKNKENERFFNKILSENRNSLIFISKNETEDSVWPEYLQDLPN